MFLAHVIGGKHLSAATDFRRWSAGPRPTWCSPGSSCSPAASREHPAPATWWSSTSAAPPPTCTACRARPRGRGRPVARGRRGHPGHPHRRGRPRHALVGAVDVPRPGLGDLGRGGRRAPRATTRASSPPTTPRPTSTSGSRTAAVGLALRRHAGRAPGGRQPRGPGRRADRQGPARGRPAGRVRRRAAARPARGRRAGARRQPRRRRRRAAGSCPAQPRVVVDRDYVLGAIGLLAGPTTRLAARPALSSLSGS